MKMFLLVLIMFLTSCSVVEKVRTVFVTKRIYTPASVQDKKLPEELKHPCLYVEMQVLSNKELVRVQNINKASLIQCEQNRQNAVRKLEEDGYQ